MEYRGFLIAKLPEGDSYYPWAFGRVGYGIAGWTHTRREAKGTIDRMLAGLHPAYHHADDAREIVCNMPGCTGCDHYTAEPGS